MPNTSAENYLLQEDKKKKKRERERERSGRGRDKSQRGGIREGKIEEKESVLGFLFFFFF